MKAVFLALLLCCTVSSYTTTELSNTSSRNCSDPDLYKHYDRPIYYVGIASIVFFVLSIPFLLGFGEAGVRGRSCAAMCHAGIGNVEAGGCFACCQSLGTRQTIGFVPFVFAALVIALLVLFVFGYAVPWWDCFQILEALEIFKLCLGSKSSSK